jgi:hypothetical protein
MRARREPGPTALPEVHWQRHVRERGKWYGRGLCVARFHAAPDGAWRCAAFESYNHAGPMDLTVRSLSVVHMPPLGSLNAKGFASWT